jgi:hypothetical protein
VLSPHPAVYLHMFSVDEAGGARARSEMSLMSVQAILIAHSVTLSKSLATQWGLDCLYELNRAVDTCLI